MSEELIRRSDAIKAIDELPNAYNGWSDTYDKAYIIGTLEEVPSADRPQGEVDAIDRGALIDYCLKLIDVERKQGSDVMNYGQERVNQTEAIIDYIEHMPHINVDRPQGEWIEKIVDNVKITVCSNCDKEPTFTHYYGSCGNYSLSDFCPNCGADMREREVE